MPKKAREIGPLEVSRLKKPGAYCVGGVSGLILQVIGNSRSWLLRVRVGSKRREIGLGAYPDVTLAMAREKARTMRDTIKEGNDPIAERRAARVALAMDQAKEITFDEATRQFLESKLIEFRNPKHAAQWGSTLKTYASPIIGRLPVGEIGLNEVIRVLDPLWESKTETATRLRGRIEKVFAWATARGYRTGDNPARWKGNLDAVLAKPNKVRKVQHMAAISIEEIGGFVLQLREREAGAARALEFAILTACRSGEARGATWDEIDLTSKIWTIPESRTKTESEHQVPLSNRALEIIEALPHREGLLFPGPDGGALSENALVNVIRRMGRTETAHGFRSTFRDWCGDRTNYPRDLAEMALAHALKSKSEAAYRRLKAVEKRRPMMEAWAKWCSTEHKPGEVVPLNPAERMTATSNA
jgi:integrase